MSVLIRGMKMPETCMRCDFLRFYNVYCCGLLVKKIDNGNRREDCPLVEVPPHGRLIDADALIGNAFNGEQNIYCWDEIEKAIDDAPTIIEAEE